MKKVIMVLALTGLVVPATFASQGQGQQEQTQQTQTKKKAKKRHRAEKKPEVKKPQ
jgi:uncharacterized protein YdeI (BOF family)